MSLAVVAPGSDSYTYVAGSVSRPFVITSQSQSSVFYSPSQSVTITPTANFADAQFNPSSITLTAPDTTASFTVVTNTLGTLVVGFTVTGDGSNAFSQIGSAQLNVTKRSFDIDSNLFINTEFLPVSNVFVHGVTSRPFTIYARSVTESVTLTVSSLIIISILMSNSDYKANLIDL